MKTNTLLAVGAIGTAAILLSRKPANTNIAPYQYMKQSKSGYGIPYYAGHYAGYIGTGVYNNITSYSGFPYYSGVGGSYENYYHQKAHLLPRKEPLNSTTTLRQYLAAQRKRWQRANPRVYRSFKTGPIPGSRGPMGPPKNPASSYYTAPNYNPYYQAYAGQMYSPYSQYYMGPYTPPAQYSTPPSQTYTAPAYVAPPYIASPATPASYSPPPYSAPYNPPPAPISYSPPPAQSYSPPASDYSSPTNYQTYTAPTDYWNAVNSGGWSGGGSYGGGGGYSGFDNGGNCGFY